MGKIIDISSKLSYEPKFIHLAEGKDYKINESKNTVIKVLQLWDNEDGENEMSKIDKMISLVLGNKALKDINEMDINIEAYKTIAITIMAAITGTEVEEIEDRFQKSQKELSK